MRWETAPEEYDWHLPDSYAVQSLLLTAVRQRTDERPQRTMRSAPARLPAAA
jgi:hypothetical protein